MNEKRRKKKLTKFIFIISILLVGCGVKEEGESNMENENALSEDNGKGIIEATEYMDYYGITDEELEGINLQEILDYYNYKKQGLGYLPKEEVLSVLKNRQKRMEEEKALELERAKSNVSYLVQADERIGEYPEFDTIKYLTYYFDYSDDIEIVSGLVDFQNNKLYLDSLDPIYEYYKGSNEVYELSEEQISEIIQAVKETKFQNWKYHTIGEGDTGYNWKFGMEFEDETVISFIGEHSEPIFYNGILDVIVNFQK